MNRQLTTQMSILIYLPVPIGNNEGMPPRKPHSLLYLFATLFTWIGRIKSNGANKTYVLRSEIRRNQEHCLQQMYAWRQQILLLLWFRIKAMRRVPEMTIFLRNNNCSTALSTARCYFEATDDFPIFLSSWRLFLKIFTEIKWEDIIQSLISDTKNSDIPGIKWARWMWIAFAIWCSVVIFWIFDCAKFSSARNASWVNMGL